MKSNITESFLISSVTAYAKRMPSQNNDNDDNRENKHSTFYVEAHC